MLFLYRKTTKSDSTAIQNTAVEKVFRVNELLEAILVFLSEHDILYNAQRVSQTWKNCIQASKPLQEACWLRPIPMVKDTDPLFLPLSSLFEIGWADKRPVLELQQELGGSISTPRAIAKAFADGKIDIHTYWFGCLMRPVPQATQKQIAENERDRQSIAENCPVTLWQGRLHDQLDRSHLHPILSSFNHILHFWTGYGNHVILALDEEATTCYRQVAEFMETLMFLLQSEPPQASWRSAYITRPACTKVTVTGRKVVKPTIRQSFECSTGITVEALFRVVVNFSERYFGFVTEDKMKYIGLGKNIEDRNRIGRAIDEYAALDLQRFEGLNGRLSDTM